MNPRIKRIEKAIKRIPVHHEIDPEIQATIDRVRAEVNSEEYKNYRPKPPTPEELDESYKKIAALKESIMRGMK
jgi:hypothetical protein